jgi:hypothetical protein
MGCLSPITYNLSLMTYYLSMLHALCAMRRAPCELHFDSCHWSLASRTATFFDSILADSEAETIYQ